MKKGLFLTSVLLVLTILTISNSCKKDKPIPSITFALTEGVANANGEYTITGIIHSDVSLSKVILTKEGATSPFFTDDTTAKNKNDYNFSYLITGITANTYIVFDIYDLNGGKQTTKFLIRK